MCERDTGVIHIGRLTVIRKLGSRHGLPIRGIARRTGLSRTSIKKHLNDDAIEPAEHWDICVSWGFRVL
jgi:hypothetical protein